MRVPLMYRMWQRDERGAAAILTAILITVLMGFMAFVTDFGMAYSNKRGLQNGADSAALAVAQQIASEGAPTATCAQLRATWDSAATEAMAQDYFAKNRPGGDSALTHFELVCMDGDGDGDHDMLVVETGASQNSPSFFGGLFGQDDVDLDQAAKAVVGPVKAVVGLRPFAVCKGVAEQVINNATVNHTLVLDNTDFGCGGASGNWGMIDFNGGSNPTHEVADWIQNGYNGPIGNSPPTYLPGDPGAPSPGALQSEMNGLLDDEIVIPVYDLLAGSGNNAQFRVMGFLSIKVCGWKFQNKNGAGACFVASTVPVPVPQNYLQVRYIGFVPIGNDISQVCTFANTACDLGTRGFELAD